jgi:hypothetical protein
MFVKFHIADFEIFEKKMTLQNKEKSLKATTGFFYTRFLYAHVVSISNR